MSVFRHFWSTGGIQEADGSHSDRQREQTAEKEVEVDLIRDDQPFNPYTEIQILAEHSDIVRHLLQIDNARCASAGDDNTIVIWDIQSGRKVCVLKGHNRPITCLLLLKPEADSGEEPFLLSGASDKQICVWDIINGECLQKITDHCSSVKCLLELSEKGIFCSGGEKLCAWDRHGNLLHCFNRPQEEADIHLLIPIKNSRVVAATDRQLDIEQSQEIVLLKKLPPHRESIGSLITISDVLFASGSIDGTIMLWTTQTLTPTRFFNSMLDYEGYEHLYPYSVQKMCCVEKRYLFAAVGSGFCVYDTLSGRLVTQKQGAHYSKVLHLQFVYDGAFLATCSEDGSLRLWGCEATQKAGSQDPSPIPTSTPSVMERFLGCSKQQMQASKGESSIKEPDLLGECLGHSGSVQMFLNYGLDGLVSCGMDGLVIVWKVIDIFMWCFRHPPETVVWTYSTFKGELGKEQIDGARQDWQRGQLVRHIVYGSTLSS